MQTDIRDIDDIKILLDTFYIKVLKDETIGYIFNDVAKINMIDHMPVLYNFWDSVLFGTASYKGNAILKHIELNKMERLTDEHFDQWIKLFYETIDELFIGAIATLAKEKAKSLRFMMQHKIKLSEEPGFIQ
jgi:hemoglobin